MSLPQSLALMPNTVPTQNKLIEKSPAPVWNQTKDLGGYLSSEGEKDLKRNVIK